MALFDFLKRKKQVEKAKKPAAVKVEKKTEKKEEPKPVQPVTKNKKSGAFSYRAVKHPHISEKASLLAEKDNQYIFKVEKDQNKREIKKSIEGIYGVDVLSVNIIKIPSKKRRLGRIQGLRKSYKKAVVKIKEGQKIEIL